MADTVNGARFVRDLYEKAQDETGGRPPAWIRGPPAASRQAGGWSLGLPGGGGSCAPFGPAPRPSMDTTHN